MVSVLNCAPDDELRSLRAAVLNSVTCEVVSPASPEEAIRQMQGSRFDVLLLCYQLESAVADNLRANFMRLSPAGRVVCLEYFGRFPNCRADVVVSAASPAALLAAVAGIRFPDGQAGIGGG